MEASKPDRGKQTDRTGGGPTVPGGLRIYAVGDIHGRADLLSRLLGRIAADADRPGTPEERRIVFLGDYVDRGPDSDLVLDLLVEDPPAGLETVFLRGNHESMMLEFVEGVGAGGDVWLANGGRTTLQAYGVDPFAVYFDAASMTETAAALRAVLPPRHLAFLRGLETYHQAGDYLFVHAGVRPGVPLAAQTPGDLLWIRRAFLDSEADHGQVVVHGHSITAEPEVRTNRIGIDTGAFTSGRLTCLVLEGGKHRFLTTA